MEMLPALALFACVAAAAVERRFTRQRDGIRAAEPIEPVPAAAGYPVRPFYLAALALAVVNPLAMIYGTALVQRCAQLIERHPSNLLANYASAAGAEGGAGELDDAGAV